jgi:hypothetical protein
MANTPMTKLDAVNICLSSMGEPVINTLDGASVDAQIASDIVDEVSRSVQAEGWHWNRERHVLSPNSNKEILLPANTARIDTIEDDRYTDVIQRGGRLFNRSDNSYSFEKPLKLRIYVLLPFEDLPLAAKNYVTYKAARLFQQRVLGSETISKFNKEEEGRAWLTLLQAEADTGDYNMLTDSWQTYSILSRGHFARGGY